MGWVDWLLPSSGGGESIDDRCSRAHGRWLDYDGRDDEQRSKLAAAYEALSAERRRRLG